MTTAADDGRSGASAGAATPVNRPEGDRRRSEEASRTIQSFERLLADFRHRLETDLGNWLAAKERLATSESPAAHEITGVLSRFVDRDGKRIRPALLFYAYQACRGQAEEKAMTMAMAVEMLHTYLLIHDDIMDHADTRRGEPSVHVLFSDLHRSRSWSGDLDHFGESVAILVGDLAQSYATELFSSVEVAPEVAAEFRDCYSTMCQEVIIGQYLEMTAANRPELGEDELLRVLQMKSGRYSVQRPVQLGALLARAPQAMRQDLTRYGAKIGEAFQLQDDLLGMFGDSATVGKPVGSDLIEGKFTVLIHHAVKNLSSSDSRRLLSALGNVDLPSDEVAEIQGLIAASGAKQKVEEMIESRMQEARLALEGLDLERSGAEFLMGIVDYLRGRQR
ncbi:MAG: polyprenyl synthetase family protein [Acidobacteriota bacterium]